MLLEFEIDNNIIDFAPDNLHKEIIQNVITICSTLKGTVPMDREFGIDGDILDSPSNVARARLSARYIEAIRKYEPRCEVVSVNVRVNEAGELRPLVKIRVKD